MLCSRITEMFGGGKRTFIFWLRRFFLWKPIYSGLFGSFQAIRVTGNVFRGLKRGKTFHLKNVVHTWEKSNSVNNKKAVKKRLFAQGRCCSPRRVVFYLGLLRRPRRDETSLKRSGSAGFCGGGTSHSDPLRQTCTHALWFLRQTTKTGVWRPSYSCLVSVRPAR